MAKNALLLLTRSWPPLFPACASTCFRRPAWPGPRSCPGGASRRPGTGGRAHFPDHEAAAVQGVITATPTAAGKAKEEAVMDKETENCPLPADPRRSWPGCSARRADPLARMATIAALLYHKFDYYFWCGFYRLVDGDLVVGPYQGPLACQVLARDRGVCWEAVTRGETVVVPDVRNFRPHRLRFALALRDRRAGAGREREDRRRARRGQRHAGPVRRGRRRGVGGIVELLTPTAGIPARE